MYHIVPQVVIKKEIDTKRSDSDTEEDEDDDDDDVVITGIRYKRTIEEITSHIKQESDGDDDGALPPPPAKRRCKSPVQLHVQ